jgi:transposase
MAINELLLGAILALHGQGLTQDEIAQITGVSQGTISRCLERNRIFGPITHRRGNGRPSVVTEEIESAILAQNKADTHLSLRKHAVKLANEHGATVSYNTVRNVLENNSLYAYSPAKKPALSAKHIRTRFLMAQSWLGLTERELQSIVFSDESKFNLLYSDGKPFVWRGPDCRLMKENIIETKKFGGGSIMVWACFSYHGVGKLVIIKGIMDAYRYVNILSSSLPPSLESMGVSDFIFQQDNDSKHTAKVTKQFFESRSIKVLPWPAMSPDMNPIENLWSYVKRRVSESEPKNLADLEVEIKKAWYSIPKEVCQNYAMSFSRRALALCRSRGGHTKY